MSTKTHDEEIVLKNEKLHKNIPFIKKKMEVGSRKPSKNLSKFQKYFMEFCHIFSNTLEGKMVRERKMSLQAPLGWRETPHASELHGRRGNMAAPRSSRL